VLFFLLFFSCEDQEESEKEENITCDEISIYIPTDEEISNYITTYGFLLDLESGKIPVEKKN
jgi:hypothetical protein